MKLLRKILPLLLLLAVCMGAVACADNVDISPNTTSEADADAEEMCTCASPTTDAPYCVECGKKTAVFDEFWNCPSCGENGLRSHYCEHCGTARPVIETESVETEEDLGGAFSPERLSYALRMTLLGMGMVFAVLAILWMILAIFKVALGGKSTKPAKTKPEPQKAEPTENAATPLAPVGTDPVVIAAITAAIAETIAADPELSEQFSGGFRVVSFKRKTGKTSWNH